MLIRFPRLEAMIRPEPTDTETVKVRYGNAQFSVPQFPPADGLRHAWPLTGVMRQGFPYNRFWKISEFQHTFLGPLLAMSGPSSN